MAEVKSWTWRHAIIESDLQPTTRHVLLTLSCHISDSGRAVPVTIVEMVKHTGLSKPAVMKHLEMAAISGWISVKKHGLSGQRWNANEYQITVPGTQSMPELLPQGGQRDLPKSANAVNVVDQKAVNDVAQKAVNVVDRKAVNDVDHLTLCSSLPPCIPPTGFSRFWAAYPDGKHIAKAKCERFWIRHNLEPLTDRVIAGVEVWKRSKVWQDGFVCHPATFLNQQRWMPDSLPKDASPKATGSYSTTCQCGAPGVVSHDGKHWHCRAHDPERQEIEA